MKITGEETASLNKTELTQLNKQKKELKFLGSIRKVRGHTLFSINTKTGEIKPAEYRVKKHLAFHVAKNKDRVSEKKEVVAEKDCIYRQALNKKNLIRKLIKEVKGERNKQRAVKENAKRALYKW